MATSAGCRRAGIDIGHLESNWQHSTLEPEWCLLYNNSLTHVSSFCVLYFIIKQLRKREGEKEGNKENEQERFKTNCSVTILDHALFK